LSTENLIGLFVVLLGAGLIFAFGVLRKDRSARSLRPIRAVQQLRRAIGLAVEDGKGLHVSLGKASLLDPDNTSALAGLCTLERLGQISMVSDHPPIATSGEGALAILSKDTLRSVYRSGNALEQFDPDQGQLSGPTAFAYVAGAIPVVRDKQVFTNVLMGSFGPEAALLCDAAGQNKTFTLAVSDSLPAQSVFYAAAQEPLIGEEMFALPAYLQAGPFHQASVQAQDLLRWVVMILMGLGVIYKLLDQLFGISLL